jgi:hypothetical protein
MLQALDTEIATFESRLDEFLRDHPGEYVLIRGATVHGFFPDMDAAIAAGYRLLGGGPFLAKRVEVEVPAVFSSTFIRPPHGR